MQYLWPPLVQGGLFCVYSHEGQEMFYIDCACQHHDIWSPFNSLQEAERRYNLLTCPSKILYTRSPTGGLIKIKESK